MKMLNIPSPKSLLIDVRKKFNNRLTKRRIADAVKGHSQAFIHIYVYEQTIFMTHISSNQASIDILDHIEVQLPSNIISEEYIENKAELSQIIIDMVIAINAQESPIILSLASSKFMLYSFEIENSIEINSDDKVVISKSPFLKDQTLIKEINQNKNDINYKQYIYTNIRLIDGWLSVLKEIKHPTALLAPSYTGTMKLINKQSSIKRMGLVLSIAECGYTTILVQKADGSLKSYQIPFGTEIYANKSKNTEQQYFKRLKENLTMSVGSELKLEQFRWYVTGPGLDLFTNEHNHKDIGWVIHNPIQKVNLDKKLNQEHWKREQNTHLFNLIADQTSAIMEKKGV